MALETLKKQRDFDLVYKKGKVFFGKNIALRFLPAKGLEEGSLYAIVISTKVSKKAVERNLKKRQMREIIRASRDKIKKGFMFLVIFQEGSIGSSYTDLEKEFLYLAGKSGSILI